MKLKIDMSDELNQKLYKAAEIMGTTKNDLVIDLIQFYLVEYEGILETVADYEEQVRNGTLVTYSLEEIKRRHDLD